MTDRLWVFTCNSFSSGSLSSSSRRRSRQLFKCSFQLGLSKNFGLTSSSLSKSCFISSSSFCSFEIFSADLFLLTSGLDFLEFSFSSSGGRSLEIALADMTLHFRNLPTFLSSVEICLFFSSYGHQNSISRPGRSSSYSIPVPPSRLKIWDYQLKLPLQLLGSPTTLKLRFRFWFSYRYHNSPLWLSSFLLICLITHESFNSFSLIL